MFFTVDTIIIILSNRLLDLPASINIPLLQWHCVLDHTHCVCSRSLFVPSINIYRHHHHLNLIPLITCHNFAILSTVYSRLVDLQPVDIKSRWRHNWKSAQVVNSHLVCDPTIRQPGFDLPQQQWSLLNHFRMEQGHCSTCRRKWRLTDTDLCPCGETQTMSHIVESCPRTKLNGSLSRLHSADEDAVSWLISYGS